MTGQAIKSEPQHLRALHYGNGIRIARADLKRKITAGDLTIADAIRRQRDETDGMRIVELLGSQNRWGLARCRKFMESIGLPEEKRLGSLTERQRVALTAILDGQPPERSAAPVTYRAAVAA